MWMRLSQLVDCTQKWQNKCLTCPRRPFSYCQAPKVGTAAAEKQSNCFLDGGASAKCYTAASDDRRGAAEKMRCFEQLQSHYCNSKKKMALIDCRGMPVSRHGDWWFIQGKCHVATARRQRFDGCNNRRVVCCRICCWFAVSIIS